MEILIDRLKISARDQFQLAVLKINAQRTLKGRAIINSGTGIRKEFYLKFITYLAEHGYESYVYDYRGIGESKPESGLRGFDAQMGEWATLDMAGMIDYISNKKDDIPLYIIGHSIGGQVIGFLDNSDKIKRIITIAASSGYWKYMNFPLSYYTMLIWYIGIPLICHFNGFFPSSKLKLGEDLPYGVAKEWAKWCKAKEYFTPQLGNKLPNYFDEITIPLDAIWFTDDLIANKKTVNQILSFYNNAQITTHKTVPKDVGLYKIGHFGFFKEQSRESLWPRVLSILNS